MKSLEEIAESIAQLQNPPVHDWQPRSMGEIDIYIDCNGAWWHEGELIQRETLVNLFASILWHENDQYFLITPAEKLRINVEDAPFLVHQAEYVEEAWVVTTNLHQQVIVNNEYPVELRLYKDQWVPYVRIRYNLWARVNRSIYVQWINQAMQLPLSENDALLLSSQGYRFQVARE